MLKLRTLPAELTSYFCPILIHALAHPSAQKEKGATPRNCTFLSPPHQKDPGGRDVSLRSHNLRAGNQPEKRGNQDEQQQQTQAH